MFYCYGLFQDMRRVLQGTASRAPFPAGLLAIVWIVLTLAARAPSAPTNGNFSPLNILACVFGSAFLVLLAFAMFDPVGLAALGN